MHGKKIKISDDVEYAILARGTPGLSGADLANMVNEAALLAARKDHKAVDMDDFEEAKDKVMMGPERRSLVISPDERRMIAYHEAGHALVAKHMPNADPVHKVTIIPRGLALGLTHYLPVDERHTHSKERIETQLVYAMGGRVAEKVVFDQLTTGAKSDLERATDIAQKMVCQWGMSERLGPITYGKREEQIFLGREISQHRDYSEETARLIDEEVKNILERAENKALEILTEHRDQLDKVAEALLEREILDGHAIEVLVHQNPPAIAAESLTLR